MYKIHRLHHLADKINKFDIIIRGISYAHIDSRWNFSGNKYPHTIQCISSVPAMPFLTAAAANMSLNRIMYILFLTTLYSVQNALIECLNSIYAPMFLTNIILIYSVILKSL